MAAQLTSYRGCLLGLAVGEWRQGCAALAEALRQTAERLMAPYAVPADVVFRRVRG